MAEAPATNLVRGVSELLSLISTDPSTDVLFEAIVAGAITSIEPCDYASLTLMGPGDRIRTPAASDPLVLELDGFQYHFGEGPCLEALRSASPSVYSPDLATDTRWPAFGPRASERGIGSLISYRLGGDGTIGALNLYATSRDAYREPDQDVAQLFASFAAMVVSYARERMQVQQLLQALESRDTIGQAKGILMERQRVTADEAFDMLRRASQTANRKLRDLAEELTRTGQGPSLPRQSEP